MTKIKLINGTWEFDEARRLGSPGGFGEVFLGEGALGAVAVKRLKLDAAAAAHRELKIGQFIAGRKLQHVVPVLDYGQDAESDRYYLVMPVCDESLEDFIRRHGNLTWAEAQPILLQIIVGLKEVEDIVHRDLKPSNVLFLEGRWQIADFGIAKFVEDSTSLHTLRDALSPCYAAPEQWRGESPTKATDVYALGCITHALLTGRPPFSGSVSELQEAHLKQLAPPIEGMPRLNGLVTNMLRKEPASRPSIRRCESVFADISSAPLTPSRAALAEVGNQILQENARAEAERAEARRIKEERQRLAEQAASELDRMIQRLFSEIRDSTDAASVRARTVHLGPAVLTFVPPEPRQPSYGQRRLEGVGGDSKSVDVLTHATLTIENFGPHVRESSYSVSVTLFFGKCPNQEEFRWHEVSFWSFSSPSRSTPFALSAFDRDFHLALGPIMHSVNVAHGPLTIDGEDEDAFLNRWLSLFTRAAQGTLRHPGQMPPPKAFFD